ncbi:hypothetical protein [Marinobacter sp. NFXS9]|uniref:phage tail tape measure protein n=1 Tax=Marinobacter sp. NFXS9 TaxID=2818433 RepID=UPI0032DED5BF
MANKSLDLQVILAARDKITGPLKKINATSTGTARALKQNQQEIKQLKASQRDVSSFKKLDRSIRENSQSLNTAQERVRQLGDELRNTSKPTDKLRSQYNKARREVDKFTATGQQQRKELGRVRDRLKQAGVDTRNLSQEEQRLADRMVKANDRIQRQKRYLDKLGKADVSGKFNNMTSEVGKASRTLAVGGATIGGTLGLISHGYAENAEEVDQWAKRLGLATKSLSEWQYLGRQFGVDSDAMIDAIKELSLRTDEFAVTGKGPAADAFQRLGLGQKELAAASGDTDRLMQMVLNRMRSIENVAARQRLADELFGGTGGEQLAEVASLSAKEIGTLKSEAEDLGATVGGKGAKDARAYMKEWRRVQGGLQGVRNTIATELLPFFTDVMSESVDWLKENRSEVNSFASSLSDGFRSALPVAKDLFSGIAAGARTVASLVTSLATLVGGFDNLGMILAFIFALKPVMTILAFGKAIFSASSAIIGLAGGLPAIAAGIKAIGLAIAANPIGLIITGIAAAIGGAVYLIYKNWDGITGWFSDRWRDIKAAFDGGLSGIGKLILNWSPLGLFYKAFSKVLSWFGVDLPDTFTGFGSQILEGLVGGITGGLKKVKDTIVNAGKATIGWFKDVLGIKSPSRVFMGAGRDTLEGYRKGLEQQEPHALKQVSGFGRRVRRAGAGIAIGAAALPAAAGSVQFDSRPPVAAQAPAATQSGGDQYTFNVYAAPGQSAEEVAAQVQRILEERDRRKATRARSALYDRS